MKEGYYYPSKQFIREYYKQDSANKFDNLNEMNKFLESHKLPKLSQGKIKSLNRTITSKETKTITTKKNPPTKKKSLNTRLHW